MSESNDTPADFADLMTPRELCQKFPIFTLRRLAFWRERGRGGPKFYRIEGRISYSLADVRAYISASLVVPESTTAK